MTTINKRSKFVISSVLAGSVAVSACVQSPLSHGRFCKVSPDICAMAAFVIIAGIMAATAGSGSPAMMYAVASDPSLKTDVQYLQTLDNGIRIYAFRYKGQEEGFVGVMADDLLKDPRYAHSVSRGPNGVLVVDYHSLPVQLFNYQAMVAASEKALKQLDS
jgi:hypothetical protein